MFLKRLIGVTLIRLIGFFIACCILGLSVVRWIFSSNKENFWKPENRATPPACLLSPVYGRHRHVQLKNIRLHCVENGDSKKPLMLLLHGFPEFWYAWKNQLRAFHKTHWVVAVDMRGYGESDKPRGSRNYSVPVLVEDIRQLIEALGKETCVLVGHDWGGSIGWHFAATYPNMLTHYIAINIPHPVAFSKHLRSSMRQLVFSWYMYYFQIPYIPELTIGVRDNQICERIASVGVPAGQDPSEEIEAYKYPFSQQGAWTPPLNYYREAFSLSSNIWQNLENKLRVRVPTLLIFGKKDHALDYRMAEKSGQYVDNFQCKLLDECDHWPQREDPETVNQYIEQFLGVDKQK